MSRSRRAELVIPKLTFKTIMAKGKRVKGKDKGAKRRGYIYTARVIGGQEGFVIETPKPLEADNVVKRDGLEYRVAYVYSTGSGASSEAYAILHPPKRRPGRPRKKARK